MTFTQLSISRNAPLRSVARITLCAAALIGAGGASAQAFDAVRLYGAKPGQDGGLIGLGFIGGTEYRGSDERKTTAVPLIDYQWANGWFAGTGNGVGYNFSKRTDLQYGARLTFGFRATAHSGAACGAPRAAGGWDAPVTGDPT